jgi:methylamine dehydrogenase heavy chain
MTGILSGARVVAVVALSSLGWSASANAELVPDPLAVQQLPEKPGAHWVWANDIVFHHMVDGKAFLLDGDSGRMLGMLSTGFNFNGVVIGKGAEILSPETYFSRGTRGTRTDVVTLYGARTLSPIGEVSIPPKRASTMPMLANTPLTDDSRFLLIYNFTPAQSVSVVDVPARKFVGEIEIPGCALIYPTGPRSFFSLCGDGTAMQVQLDDGGKPIKKNRTAKVVDPENDPVTEKGVRDGNGWIFVTFSGMVVRLETMGGALQAAPSWSLLDAADRKASWRPGGLQHLSLHSATRRLYSLMHVGGDYSHKDPGNEVWVYDVATKKRTQRIQLKAPATSIAVTRDSKPLLFTSFMGASGVNVYDAVAGGFLRGINEVGLTPTTLITY